MKLFSEDTRDVKFFHGPDEPLMNTDTKSKRKKCFSEVGENHMKE